MFIQKKKYKLSNFFSIFPFNFYVELLIGLGEKFEFKSFALIGSKNLGGKMEEKLDKVNIWMNLFNQLPLKCLTSWFKCSKE